jgi:plasmid maintenance system antidote protein VapI
MDRAAMSYELRTADVAGYLNVSEETASSMIKGESELTPTQQKLVAVCLRGKPRDFFTDIAPS